MSISIFILNINGLGAEVSCRRLHGTLLDPNKDLTGFSFRAKSAPCRVFVCVKKGTTQSPVGAFKCNLEYLDVNSVWKHFTLSQ